MDWSDRLMLYQSGNQLWHSDSSFKPARYPRVMRRTTVAGEGPTAEPPFATRTPAWDGIIPGGVGAA